MLETVSNAEKLERVSKTVHLSKLAAVMAVAAFAVWSVFFKLDIMSLTMGSVEPLSKVQSVQHLEGGIVKKLLIREGDFVEVGEPLVELESVAFGADVGELHSRRSALEATIYRLEAELAGAKELVLPDEFVASHPELAHQTISVFQARLKSLEQRIAVQRDEVRYRNLEVEEIKARLTSAKQRLELVDEQVAISQELMERNLSNRFDHMERMKEQNDLVGSIAVDTASLKKAREGLKQANNKMTNIRAAQDEENATLKADIQQQLAELSQRVDKFEDNLDRTILRAPMTGVVKSLFFVTEGGVIPPGGTVLEIVPGDQGLIIESKLAPQDIGHVSVGQKAIVQLASGEAARFGKIEGEVVSISPDTHMTEQGEVFYVVRVATKESKFKNQDVEYALTPGVMVTASIVTGQRTVFEYLFSPFLSNIPFALTER